MEVKYTRHAIVDSMPDEKISEQEVERVIRKAEFRERLAEKKYRFRYKDVEAICVKTPEYWLVVTCYRIR